MKLALRELRRRPGRFGVATGVLTLISILLLFLGGLLDGLFLGSTGMIRSQKADLFVYTATARDSFLRSRVTPELRAKVAAVPGVRDVSGLGVTLLGARVPGRSDLANVVVVGYERAARGVPSPPPAGAAYADRRLLADGVKLGSVLEVGPARSRVRVVGFVRDTNYLLQGALWVTPTTWRSVQNTNRPDARVADGVFQVVTAVAGEGVPSRSLVAAIDRATGGETSTLTRAEAVLSLPGTKEQQSTFLQIIFTTLFVAVVVVGLFFSLLTIERTALYGVLKAIGASSRQLFAGVVAQAVAVTGVALVAGSTVTGLLSLGIPPQVPLQLVPGRLLFVAVGMLGAAVLGSIVSLRRVVRIDPASAIGSSS